MSKNINPFIINKETSPYLYLTEYGGIYLTEFDSEYERTISIPINNDNINNTYLAGIEIWTRYPLKNFSGSANFISVINDSGTENFYIDPDPGYKRAKINSTNNNIVYYQNGKETIYPAINYQEWVCMYIYFNNHLDISNSGGKLLLHKGFVFNNISFFVYTNRIGEINKTSANIFNNQVGINNFVIEDLSSINIYSNGADIFTDISWQTIEKKPS